VSALPSPARGLVRRFDSAELVLHWGYAVLFAVLLLTGLGLYLPPGQNPVLDRRELVREVHLDAAIGLVLLPVLVAGAWPRSLARFWHDVERFDADDAGWLRRVVVPRRLRRRPLPTQDRFNAGQKLNSIVVAAATVGFIVTGCLMWQGEHLPTSLSEAADSWHIWLMLAMFPLIAGHLVLALLLPSTRPAMRGIVTGRVRLDFARRRHAKWTSRVAERGDPAD
jgi:formate dehydrogenase subunit gamma